MQLQRAQEIIQADAKITVALNGTSVWIESVDAEKNMAKIHLEEKPNDVRTVPVEQLEEVH